MFSVPRLSTIGQGKALRRLGRGKEQLKKLRRNQGKRGLRAKGFGRVGKEGVGFS